MRCFTQMVLMVKDKEVREKSLMYMKRHGNALIITYNGIAHSIGINQVLKLIKGTAS